MQKIIFVFALCVVSVWSAGHHHHIPGPAVGAFAHVKAYAPAVVAQPAVVTKKFAVAEPAVQLHESVAYGSVPVNKVINEPTVRYAQDPPISGYSFNSEVRHDKAHFAAPVLAAAPVALAAPAIAAPLHAPIVPAVSAYSTGISHDAFVGAAPAKVLAAPALAAAPLVAPAVAAPIAYGKYAGYAGALHGGYAGALHAGYAGPAYAGYAGPAYAGYAGPAYAGYAGPVGEHVGAPIAVGQDPALVKGYSVETGRHELHQSVHYQPAVIPTTIRERVAIPTTIAKTAVHHAPLVAPVAPVVAAKKLIAPAGLYAGYGGHW